MSIRSRYGPLALVAGICPTMGVHAASPAEIVREWSIPAQPLAATIAALALRSGTSIVAPADLLAGRNAPALSGRFSLADALSVALGGSPLRWRRIGAAIVIDAAPTPASTPVNGATTSDAIVVTGSRIRGAPAASEVIVLSREAIRNTGQSTLAEALAVLPQNFGGGQNPGIGFNVPQSSGFDLGGGSSVNLRGLGSDATLTLLDGHRLAYNAVNQSIDISVIPLAAIDRVEVVPDGSSALFGSDAVGGVVNILLRRDYAGVVTGAKVGGATDGGYFTQQYDGMAGARWSGGGLLAAYEYGSNTAIRAGDRSYARTRSPGLDLYPAIRRHSGLVTAHQAIGPRLTLTVDGLYNTRRTDITYPLNPAGDLSVSRANSFTDSRAFGIAPTLRLAFPGQWEASLTGSYGENKVRYAADLFYGDTSFSAGRGYYRNIGETAELSANGPLFKLPAGTVKLAVGAGYRRNAFTRETGAGSPNNVDRAQDSYYGFGELSVPLVAPEQGVALVRSLNASAAVRYERYPGIDSVATPKLGLIYAPVEDLSVRGSWGRSFRAPTLFQQYQPQAVYLVNATDVGGAGTPPGATALLLLGGRGSVKPERSRNWSATLDLHPRFAPRSKIELTYFAIRYTDRIVTPIAYTSVALSNPVYASSVVRDPSEATQAAVIAAAAQYANLSDAADYDPAQVVAIVDNASINAGRQIVHGIDLFGRQSAPLADGTVNGTIDLSWLTSRQRLTPAQPETRLAGTLFNPPHFRGRAELGWTHGAVTLTASLDVLGRVRDTRTAPAVRVRGTAPVGLTARWQPTGPQGALRGLDVVASVQNLLNDKPTPIRTTLFYDAPYDSTNYSPIGRYLSLSVRKAW